jgi:hypothetical protein
MLRKSLLKLLSPDTPTGRIEPELRRLSLSTREEPSNFRVETDYPPDPERFSLWLEAEIGPKGQAGADRFEFHVCTPGWLAGEVADRRHQWGRFSLIVERWDYEQIRLVVEAICRRAAAPSWPDVSQKLAMYFLTEDAQWGDNFI